MTALRMMASRIAGFFRKQQADRELNDEIQTHMAMLEEENRRKGMSPADAHAAALREFGGIEQMKEVYRELNGLRFLETLAQDLRYSLRMLRRNPGFATTGVLLLALGIGANTAIFSAMDAVMLRLLPVKDPQQLVLLQWSSQGYPEDFVNDMEGAGRHRGSGGPFDFGGGVFSSATFEHLEGNHVFSDTFAFAGNNEQVNVGFRGRADSAVVQGVSGNYFAALGVPVILGRTISPQDDQDAAMPVAVASYNLWRQKLGQDRSIVNQTVAINGMPVTIVGVAPPEFFGLEPGVLPDFWIPLHLYSQHQEQLGNMNNGLPFVKDPKTWWLQIVGRLKPGINQAQARTELDGLFRQSLLPPGSPAVSPNKIPRMETISAKRGLDTLRLQYSQSLLLLMAMAGVVLLVACSNVAGLLLARATARRREIAVRLSLGARRFRLVRQLLTESVLLAGLGGVAGLLFAFWANSVLGRLFSSGQSPIALDLRLNGTVLAFTTVVSVLSGILFGLAPALRATREQPLTALKPGAASSGVAGHRFTSGKVLTGAQVAMSLLLLISAGLLLRTLQQLKNVNLGFDREHLVLFNVAPGMNGYRDFRLGNYYRELQRRIQSIPGVKSVSFATRAPIGEGVGSSNGSIPGYTAPGQSARLYRHAVGPGYFETLRIPLLMGRALDDRDDQGAPLAAMINETAARRWFHNDNPVGHHIVFGDPPKQRDYEIVGVVQDVKYNQLRTDMLPTIYFSYLQWHDISNWMTFEVRGEGSVTPLMSAITHEALALDKNVPITRLKTQNEVIDEMLVLERTFAALSSFCGGLALLLACVGLYGAMAYTVSRRTSEIGVRMALGAERSNILRLVLRETLIVVLIGLAAGLPLAWMATTALKSRLYGLTAHDPTTMFLATIAILAVTAIAGYLPARRASRVDPMVALRYE
jgi:predicted permease